MRLKIEIDLSGKLLEHLQSQLIDAGGLYDTSGEYLRDLIRDDFNRQHGHKLQLLLDHLKPYTAAKQAETELADIQELILASDSHFPY